MVERTEIIKTLFLVGRLLCSGFLFGSFMLAADSKSARPQPAESILKIPLWVQRAGEFENHLQAGDFQLEDGKNPRELATFHPPASPTFLFLVFDTVGEVSTVAQMRSALKQELRHLDSGYHVGLISANESFQVLQDPTDDKELLEKKIEEFNQVGKAGLLDNLPAIADFSSTLMRQSEVRVAVLCITDSDIGNYRTNYLNPVVNYSDSRDLSRRFPGRALQEKISRMTSTLSRFPVPLFILHIDPGQDPLNKIYQDGLKQIVETLGGQLFLSKTVNDIQANLREALNWIGNFYVLGFKVKAEEKGFLKLRITESSQVKSATAPDRLHYPSRLNLR